MTTLLNLLKMRKLIQPIYCRRLGGVRHLFSRNILGLNNFIAEKQHAENTLGHQKEMFMTRIQDAVWSESPIFTKDFRVLVLLAETEEHIQLAFNARDLYKKQQRESLFPGSFRHAELLLQMLYNNQKLDTAFSWFQDERNTIVHDAANVPCFLLMMDMLYEACRYDDVISLMANVDVYMNKPDIAILVTYFAALYMKNTPTALKQAASRLQDCCEKGLPLPTRCLFYTALLAYNQKEVRTMMEILELPVFYASRRHRFTTSDNLMLLAFIELGRLEECIGTLKALLMNKGRQILFRDVMSKLCDAIAATGNAELMAEFQTVNNALERAAVVNYQDFSAGYVQSNIGEKELTAIYMLTDPKNRMAVKGFQSVVP